MAGGIVVLILCILAASIHAQSPPSGNNEKNPLHASALSTDDLLRHLTNAETHQRNGNLAGAVVENHAVLAIALQRLGNVQIEEGKYADAVRTLTESLKYADTATNRTNLAIAYLRQNLHEKALSEARTAVSLDQKHVGAHYILANIHYLKEDYKAALPALERIFSESPDFEIARALGVTYLNLKQPDRARLHFEKMRVSAGKENADLHLLFAKLYERTNYYVDAERELKRAQAIAPNRPKVSFYLGYLLLQNGGTERMAEAGEAFESETKLSPSDFYSWFFAGVVASSENKHQRAIPFLKKAVEINQNSGEAYLYLAQSQIEVGELAEAEANLRRAVKLELRGGKNTQSRRTHFMLGRLLLRTGNKEEGQKELEIAGRLQQESLDSSRSDLSRILGSAVESGEMKSDVETTSTGETVQVNLPPERTAQLKKLNTFLVDVIAQALNNLGVIDVQNQRFPDGLEKFAAASAWKPDFPGLDRNWGIVAFRSGRFDEALAPLMRHIKIDPRDELARQMLGTSHYFTKNYQQAVEVLDPIKDSLAGKPELAYFYGIALIHSGRNAEATIVFNRLASAHNDSESLMNSAQGFMMLGNYERAVKELLNVSAANPDNPKAHSLTGQSLIRLNRLGDAEKAFRTAIGFDSADASLKYHLAYVLIEQKTNKDEAVSLLKEAIQSRPDFADAHYQLGKIYIEKNDTEKAIQHLESAARADDTKDYTYYQLSIAYRRASRKAESERALKKYEELKSANRKSEIPGPVGGKNKVPK